MELAGPEQVGLWWRPDATVAVATPALVRLVGNLPSLEEAAGLVLATEPRWRDKWLEIQAARLAGLGRRGEVPELCRQIDQLGPAAEAIRARLQDARLEPTGLGEVELEVFGAPADQSAAAPGLLRVLALTAPLVEGKQGRPHPKLGNVDPKDPQPNWVAGRLAAAPGVQATVGGEYVLSGMIGEPDGPVMPWVLSTPWATLLGILAFMAEAWAAERSGGVQLEIPLDKIESFASPVQVNVIVTLSDGVEVLCGTLGQLCLRVLDALGMALVPSLEASDLDVKTRPGRRPVASGAGLELPAVGAVRYWIGEQFSDDCYRGEGHRYIYRAGDHLAETLRGVCLAWARSLTVRQPMEVA